MTAESVLDQKRHTPLSIRAGRWVPAVSGLLTSAAVLLLILTGHFEAIAPVAAFGAAVTGGAAVKVSIQIRR